MRIAKKIQQQTSKISSCALESLCYQFGISTQGLHSAAVDIEATRQVYLCLKKMMTNLMADEPARASL
jgi:DNA polymerase III alpha subunit (gram-positive type)